MRIDAPRYRHLPKARIASVALPDLSPTPLRGQRWTYTSFPILRGENTDGTLMRSDY